MATGLHPAIAITFAVVAFSCSCERSSEQDPANQQDGANPPPRDDGGSGSGGSSGSGGTGGSRDAASSDAPQERPDTRSSWIEDASIWQPVPNSPCEVLVADPKKLPTMHREWKSCGPGCSQAPTLPALGVASRVDAIPFGASFRDGHLILRAVAGVGLGTKGGTLWLSTLEPEGLALGALLAPDEAQGCTGSLAFRDRADIWHVRSPQRHLVARADHAPDLGSASVWMPYPGSNTVASASSAGWGMALDNGDLVFRSWSAPAAERVGVDDTHSMSVFEDAVVWVGRMRTPRAGLWLSRPSGTPRTLWSSELTALRVAVTKERKVVWLAASGPGASEGAYESAYWYDGVLTETLELTNVQQGPEVPVTSGLLSIVAGGHFAASWGCTQTGAVECNVFVYDWQSRRTFRLRDRPGRFLREPLAIGDEQLVIGENTSNSPSAIQSLEGVLMVATSELSRVEAGW
jgi:hypothetical protein